MEPPTEETTGNKLSFNKDVKKKKKVDLFTLALYYRLLKMVPENKSYITYRFRLACCLLAITNLTISQLLKLRVKDLIMIRFYGWFLFYPKNGEQCLMIHISKTGFNLIRESLRDFDVFFIIKSVENYIFTDTKNHNKPLSREQFTRSINKLLKEFSMPFASELNLTTLSFKNSIISSDVIYQTIDKNDQICKAYMSIKHWNHFQVEEIVLKLASGIRHVYYANDMHKIQVHKQLYKKMRIENTNFKLEDYIKNYLIPNLSMDQLEKKLLETSENPKTYSLSGFLGKNKMEIIIDINLESKIMILKDSSTKKYITRLKMSPDQYKHLSRIFDNY